MAESLEKVLREHSLFRDLDAAMASAISGCASNVRFHADQEIFRAGTPANQFFLIRQGCVAIEIFVPGRGALTIQTVGAGEVLGWSWLFPPYQWHFDARATEETLAIALDGHCLRGKCEADHDLGYELMKRFSAIMTARLQATRVQLLDLYGSVR